MNIKQLFDVFSQRKEKSEKPVKALTETFKGRIFMLCRDRFSKVDPGLGSGNYLHKFWREIHQRLSYLVGRYTLSNYPNIESEVEDIVHFLVTCSDEHFLDFIEYIFQVECYQHLCSDKNTMVEQINEFFLLDDLPYTLTPFVYETRTEQYHGHPYQVLALVSYPKVIIRDQQIPYAEAISPAINLLMDKGFTSANQEFLEALEDYRKGRYGDCLTKCCSALESTMKLICARRGWTYQETDTAGPLLRIILANSSLETFFEQPLFNIATLRNRLSKSHGAGAQLRLVPPHKARYAINATAAAILLLVEECG